MLHWSLICLLLAQVYRVSMAVNVTTAVYTTAKVPKIVAKISANGLLELTQTADEMDCTRNCGRTDGCESFFYNKDNQNCRLHGRDFLNLSGVAFTEAPGYWFYRVTKRPPIDCSDILQYGKKESGVYTVYPSGEPTTVYCDQETDGGGWLVFQRRRDGSEDFYRGWVEYENGFGNISNEFWLGNKFLATLTSQRAYTLRVDLESFENETVFALYGIFGVGSVSTNYTLHVGDYSGTAGDSLKQHNGRPFSTKDRDNDNDKCAFTFKGAWWYHKCHDSNLNGLYLGGSHVSYANGINWFFFKGTNYSLKSTEMKCRPRKN